jgi:hypothetical protein
VDRKSAWETITENINISAKEKYVMFSKGAGHGSKMDAQIY